MSKIIATASLCCKIIRFGSRVNNLSMHDGLCREKHGGKLGKTYHLVLKKNVKKCGCRINGRVLRFKCGNNLTAKYLIEVSDIKYCPFCGGKVE